MKKVILALWFMAISVPALRAADSFLAKKVVKLGSPVASFELPDTNGDLVRTADFKGKIILIHFWSANCPFVMRYDERIKQIAEDYKDKNVAVLGVNANGNEPIEQIQAEVEKRKLNYPVLIDGFHQIADEFGAITTPHIFILDEQGVLVYEGAVDDQGYGADNPVTEQYVRNALDGLLAGRRDFKSETRTVGCTVKRVNLL